MEDALGLLFDTVCEWFSSAPVDGVGDVAAAAAGVAAGLAQNADPGLLSKVFDRVAKVSVDVTADAVARAIKRHLAAAPAATRTAAREFMTRIPENVRATFRRPTDRRGLTVPPAFSFRSPDAVACLLAGRPSRFQPGQRALPGVDLELETLLGVGGFGEVWKARNPLLPAVAPVALKFCTDPQAARLLRHEATVLDRVMRAGHHSGIVALRHTYLSADPPALEFEYVGGRHLGDWIAKWYAKGAVRIPLGWPRGWLSSPRPSPSPTPRRHPSSTAI